MFLCGKWYENHELGTGSVVHERIASAVERVEFVSDRMSYLIQRHHWYLMIVLNVRAPVKDNIDDVKESFYE
jgi:hypothetical protein